jgi:FkbM family methyltransferase
MKLHTVIRTLIPRPIRNALRRPKVTFSRIYARFGYFFGTIGVVSLTKKISIKCHPLCISEFNVFTHDPEQRSEMESFVRAMQPRVQFLDIGAHWGVFSLVAIKLGGSGSRSICIEASDDASQVLRENLRLNQVEELVSVVNSACGEKVGELRMLTTGAGGADYFVVPANDRPDTIVVPQVSADVVCETHSFKPTHIKIDVEGFEEEVLRGSTQIISSLRPTIFLELHGEQIRQRGKNPEAVLDFLEELGYTIWRSVEGGGQLLGRQDLAEKKFNIRLIMETDSARSALP